MLKNSGFIFWKNTESGLISMGESNLRIAFSCLEEDDIPELFDIILKGIEDLRAGAC